MNFSNRSSFVVPPPSEGRAGTSLAVRQFVELARGEREVREAANPFRVVRVSEGRRYCLGCYGVRWQDVVEGFRSHPLTGAGVPGDRFELMICRCCGKEQWNG